MTIKLKEEENDFRDHDMSSFGFAHNSKRRRSPISSFTSTYKQLLDVNTIDEGGSGGSKTRGETIVGVVVHEAVLVRG